MLQQHLIGKVSYRCTTVVLGSDDQERLVLLWCYPGPGRRRFAECEELSQSKTKPGETFKDRLIGTAVPRGANRLGFDRVVRFIVHKRSC
jgi:hypothetical protein